MRILTTAILAFALAAALVVAACGGDDGSDAPATAAQVADAAPAAADVGSRVGQRGPDLMLTSVDGEQITLSDLRGSPVVLYYFTTW